MIRLQYINAPTTHRPYRGYASKHGEEHAKPSSHRLQHVNIQGTGASVYACVRVDVRVCENEWLQTNSHLGTVAMPDSALHSSANTDYPKHHSYPAAASATTGATHPAHHAAQAPPPPPPPAPRHLAPARVPARVQPYSDPGTAPAPAAQQDLPACPAAAFQYSHPYLFVVFVCVAGFLLF